MSVIVGVAGMAILFGLFTWLRPADKGCTGNCIGCARNRACESEGTKR